jgi:hypothetical protein
MIDMGRVSRAPIGRAQFYQPGGTGAMPLAMR